MGLSEAYLGTCIPSDYQNALVHFVGCSGSSFEEGAISDYNRSLS
jgi:hypothetical protein